MDLRKLKDDAAELFAKGKFAKAAELYEQYCQHDERDHQVRLRMGDAWAKAGQRERAISAYARAAEGFAREGFLPRAIAACKLILELEPEHHGTQQLLAELYALRGGPPRPSRKADAAGSPAGNAAVARAMQAAVVPPVTAPLPVRVSAASAPADRPAAATTAGPAASTRVQPAPAVPAKTPGAPPASRPPEPRGPAPAAAAALAPENARPSVTTAAPPDEPVELEAFAVDLSDESAPASGSAFDELSLDDVPDSEPQTVAPLHLVEQAALAAQEPLGEVLVLSEDEDEGVVLDVESPNEVPRIPLFSDLPPEAFIELFERCPLHRLAQGQTVFTQGAPGDSFFVVCSGSVRVVRESNGTRMALAVLQDGAFFGEMALLSGAPRSATVESASDDTQLLELGAPLLAELSARYPPLAAALKKFCRQRMLANVMNSSPLFQQFDHANRQALMKRFRAREVGPTAVIIPEGQLSDGLYVVLSGEVEVLVEGNRVARLKEGDLFGEMSLLEKKPARATVRSLGRVSLLRLPRPDFDELISTHPQILMLVAELSDERKKQNRALDEGPSASAPDVLLF